MSEGLYGAISMGRGYAPEKTNIFHSPLALYPSYHGEVSLAGY